MFNSNFNDIKITDWLTALGTVGAVCISILYWIYNSEDLKKQRKEGIYIDRVDVNGAGNIINNSKITQLIKLERYQLAEISKDYFNLNLEEVKNDILSKYGGYQFVELVPQQEIAPKEEIGFHIKNIRAEDISCVFVLLRFTVNGKIRFYIYRYVSRLNLRNIEGQFHESLHPYNEWVKIYSFNN